MDGCSFRFAGKDSEQIVTLGALSRSAGKTTGETVLCEWGQPCARHQRKDRRLPVLDSLIAATALAHNLVIVTRNTGDYPKEIPLVSPWNQGG